MRKGTGGTAIIPLIPAKLSLHRALCRGQWRHCPRAGGPQEDVHLRTDIPPGADPDSGRLSPLIVEAVCWPCMGL